MLPILVAMGVGAVIGGVVSLGIYAVTTKFVTHKKFTWSGAGAALAGGVVAGALAPIGGGWIAAGGIKAITALATIGGVSSVVTSLFGSWFGGEKASFGSIAKGALIGAALGVATFGAGRYFAGMSGSQIQGGIAQAESALAPKLAAVVDGAEAAIKNQLDANVPAALAPALDNALDVAAKDAAAAADQGLSKVAVGADKAALDLQGHLDASWKVTPAPDAAAAAADAAPADAAPAAAADASDATAAAPKAKAPADAGLTGAVTPKQVAFINSLKTNTHVTDDQFAAILPAGKTDVADLTKAEASSVIKKLLKLEAAHPTTHATLGGGSASSLANMALGGDHGTSGTSDSSTTPATSPDTTTAASNPGDIVIRRQPGSRVTVTIDDSGTTSTTAAAQPTPTSQPVTTGPKSSGLVSLLNTITPDTEVPVKAR